MFTGLIQEKGRVVRIEPRSGGLRVAVSAPKLSGDVGIGDSISINGSCLTVVSISSSTLEFDAVRESVDRTTLGRLKMGDSVNLEPALRAGDRLGGHIVQGHVDGVGTLKKIEKNGSETRLFFAAPPEVMRHIVEKGSIAIDGISLTVAEVGPDWFAVAVIPHTLSETTLAEKKPGSLVNMETDIIGKYVFQYVGKTAAGSDQSLLNKLSEGGFLD